MPFKVAYILVKLTNINNNAKYYFYLFIIYLFIYITPPTRTKHKTAMQRQILKNKL